MLPELGREYIRKLNDPDLVEYILTGTNLYLPEAVAYAKEELEQRGLAPLRFDELRGEAARRVAAKEALAIEVASRPLGLAGKIAALLLGSLGGVHFILHMLAGDRPESRRGKDWQKFERIGFFGLISLIVLVAAIIGLLKSWIRVNP